MLFKGKAARVEFILLCEKIRSFGWGKITLELQSPLVQFFIHGEITKIDSKSVRVDDGASFCDVAIKDITEIQVERKETVVYSSSCAVILYYGDFPYALSKTKDQNLDKE